MVQAKSLIKNPTLSSDEVMSDLRTNPANTLQKRIHFNQHSWCSTSIVDMICDHICFICDLAEI